jgi:AcrR family transcriptional regulator
VRPTPPRPEWPLEREGREQGRANVSQAPREWDDVRLAAYEEAAAELCTCVTAAYDGPGGWHDRVWAAGWAAMSFLEDDPARARFLLVDVNGAGRRAQARRDRLLQRLADLLDAGRDQLEDPAAVSRCTAEIAAGAVYATLLGKVDGGGLEQGKAFLGELVYLAVMPYLGSRAAEQELLVQPLR